MVIIQARFLGSIFAAEKIAPLAFRSRRELFIVVVTPAAVPRPNERGHRQDPHKTRYCWSSVYSQDAAEDGAQSRPPTGQRLRVNPRVKMRCLSAYSTRGLLLQERVSTSISRFDGHTSCSLLQCGKKSVVDVLKGLCPMENEIPTRKEAILPNKRGKRHSNNFHEGYVHPMFYVKGPQAFGIMNSVMYTGNP